jgi:hypothetical protein
MLSVLKGDCLEVMKTLPNKSVVAVKNGRSGMQPGLCQSKPAMG